MREDKQIIPYHVPSISGCQMPMVNGAVRPMETPKPTPINPYQQWQEGISKAGEGLRLMAESFVQILSDAFKPIVDALQQVWSNLGMIHKKRPSKQTRLFLATVRKPTRYTPHAHKRRRNQRRMKAAMVA